jgi:hypothetical protein
MHAIPRDPAWCSYCIEPAKYGRAVGEPCGDHRGPDGKPATYDGRDAYDPSPWVLEVVGARYTAGDWCKRNGGKVLVYECFGYDPRHGFWMRWVDHPEVTNISERAIGRTFHRVEMSWAAWDVLATAVRFGRVPEAGEMEGYMVPACIERLRHNGYMDEAGAVTDAGRRALAARAAA